MNIKFENLKWGFKTIFRIPAEKIPSHAATLADLVAYDLDRDLLPLVVANCNYSVSVKEGATQQYDFDGMSKNIIERFVRGRGKIVAQVLWNFVISTNIWLGP